MGELYKAVKKLTAYFFGGKFMRDKCFFSGKSGLVKKPVIASDSVKILPIYQIIKTRNAFITIITT